MHWHMHSNAAGMQRMHDAHHTRLRMVLRPAVVPLR
jgi:hypothetical protein